MLINKEELFREISNIPGDMIYRWNILGLIDRMEAYDPVRHGRWV